MIGLPSHLRRQTALLFSCLVLTLALTDAQCALSGDKLFLLDSVSTDADFVNSVSVPEGFVEDALAIPPTKTKILYIKLRDDPETVDTVTLPILTTQQ